MTDYAWRPEWSPSGLDPQVAGDEIERIRGEHGLVTAEIVVREAQPKKSPLHAAVFHIRPAEAAHQYYLERARKVIQAIVIVSEGDEERCVRAFHFVRATDVTELGYMPATLVASDPYMREQIRTRLVAKMSALKKELEAWDEFAVVAQTLGDALAAA